MYVRKIILLITIFPCTVYSETPVNSTFVFSEGSYSYQYARELTGSPEKIFQILTDYNNFTQLNSNILESRILSAHKEPIKRLLKIRQCIFFFCFNLQMMEKVIESKFRIDSFIVKDNSNFSAGVASWELIEINENKTLVRLKAVQTPDFWIPPFIGPTIIKSVLFRELDETFTNLQILVST
jgi:hypothetical protein